MTRIHNGSHFSDCPLPAHQRPAPRPPPLWNLVVTCLETIIYCLHWLMLMSLSWEWPWCRKPSQKAAVHEHRSNYYQYCLLFLSNSGRGNKIIHECLLRIKALENVQIYFYISKQRVIREKVNVERWLHQPGFVFSETVSRKLQEGWLWLVTRG